MITACRKIAIFLPTKAKVWTAVGRRWGLCTWPGSFHAFSLSFHPHEKRRHRGQTSPLHIHSKGCENEGSRLFQESLINILVNLVTTFSGLHH